MSDIDGGAAASTESPSTPIELVTQTPEPVSTEREPKPEPEPKEPAKPVSTRDALAKAAETVAKREAKVEKPDDKPAPVKDAGPARNEQGKFAAKEGQEKPADAKTGETAEDQQKPATEAPKPTQRYEAPSRFSAEAKTAWETAPDAVKAETHRALNELQQGYEKHKQGAEAYESVKRFDEMARQSGTTLHDALEQYTSFENLIRQNPVMGIAKVCENAGFSLNDLVAHITKQPPEQQQSQADATIRELRGQLQQLQQQVGSVTGHIQTQQQTQTVSQINEFASKPENSRFDELADDIAFFLQSGKAKDLPEAYSMAARFNPEPAQASAPAPAATPAIDLKPQTLKGGKSITGAPSGGSDPSAIKQPASSIKEAIRRAAARAG